MDFLKKRILERIKENENLDSVDIIHIFNSINPEKIFEILNELENEYFIKRQYCGLRTKYVVLKKESITNF